MAWDRNQMAARAAQELQDGWYVNLGIGIPTLVSNYIPEGVEVTLQSENGMLGMGPFPYEGEEDPDLINAGKQTITELARTSYFDSAQSFAMIRGGKIAMAILGAMEVAENGDLANWDMRIANKGPLVGGAMDLAACARSVWVVMEHTTRQGTPRLLQACTLPLTAVRCVTRVYTDLAVIGITRAVFSNEAGIGSASIAHAAAKTDEPVSEGIVALLEPFIDTVVVCTMTGLVIVVTGVYEQPEHAELVANNDGAALTARALETVSSWFPLVLCLAVMLFAYSTMISWSYYGERCWSRLFGPRTSILYKCLFLLFVMLGSIVTATNVKDFADLMILSLAFPNILGVALLSGRVRRALDQYWVKYKSGMLEPKQAK